MSPLTGSNGMSASVTSASPRLASEQEGARPGRLSDGSARGCGGKGRGRVAGEAVKAASLTVPRGPPMQPGHIIMDWLSREPHQVGRRRRVAVLAEGRVRDGVRDRAILLARDRSSGPWAQFSAFTVAGECGGDRSDGALHFGGCAGAGGLAWTIGPHSG